MLYNYNCIITLLGGIQMLINGCNRKAIVVLLSLAALCLIFAAISLSVNASIPVENQTNVTQTTPVPTITPVPTVTPTDEIKFVPVNVGFGDGVQGYQGTLDMPVQDLRVSQT
ncbi:MAG: hypothetical protein PHH22_04090 [Clostridia bacterium]|nr:hypothetical protein [Clostridia bacterium]